MDFSDSNRTIGKTNGSEPFQFPPMTGAISFDKALQLANPSSSGDCLNVSNIADEIEVQTRPPIQIF